MKFTTLTSFMTILFFAVGAFGQDDTTTSDDASFTILPTPTSTEDFPTTTAVDPSPDTSTVVSSSTTPVTVTTSRTTSSGIVIPSTSTTPRPSITTSSTKPANAPSSTVSVPRPSNAAPTINAKADTLVVGLLAGMLAAAAL